MPPATAASLLSADHLGPAARSYDAKRTSPNAATPLERAVEQEIHPGGAPAPDALRQYARAWFELARQGQPLRIHEWFLAEHVGLPVVPAVFATFTTGSTEPADIAKLLAPIADPARKDPDLRSLAVTLVPMEGRTGYYGLLTGLVSVVDFEPFPRTVAAGKTATIPGTLFDSREAYALYVTGPGTEVANYPLAGDGAFDIEVPLPTQPGAYRVALQRARKRQPADNPFFFTLYVGQDPPTGFDVSGAGVETARAPDPATVERSFVEAVNGFREQHGLKPLTALPDAADSLRRVLDELPTDPRQQYRWLSKRFSQDPLPDHPHGVWVPIFPDGFGGADTAWMAVEHPISRQHVLDPAFDQAATAARPNGDGYLLVAVLTTASVGSASSRDATVQAMGARWPDGPPKAAPELEARLDDWCGRIAAGDWTFERAFKELKGEAKGGGLGLSGSMQTWMYEVPEGEVPDLANFAPDKSLHVLAVGDATKTRPDGVRTTLLLAVGAGAAR